jgi:epoxyqueuosine reductase
MRALVSAEGFCDIEPQLRPRKGENMKEEIRAFVLDQGADVVGFAAATDYESALSPELESILPGAKSMVVIGYRELSTCESENMPIAMNGRLDVMEFSRSVNYKAARHIENKFGGKTMTVPVSYPMTMSLETKGAVGEVSLRHAAVAAGLGVFGRHNIVIHPELGTRVLFTAVLTQLDLQSDKKITDALCINCNLCVESCPGNALAVEGKTHLRKCLSNSQPYGIGGAIKFGMEMIDAEPERKKAMLADPHFWKLYQSGFIGFEYHCFKCLASCPVGQ